MRLFSCLGLRLPPENYFLLLEIPSVFFINQNQVEKVSDAKLSANVSHGCAQVTGTQKQSDRNGLPYVLERWRDVLEEEKCTQN